MVAHSILAIVAIVAAVGLGATAATGMFSTSSAGNIDLGTLVPGQMGNATTTTTVHVTNNTTYKIGVENRDRIGSVFSPLVVTLAVNGQTFNVTSEPWNTHVTLSNGTYSFNVKLSYAVRDMVHSANESNVPFLFLHPAEMENESGDHEFENETGDNDTQDSGITASLVAADNSTGDNNSQGQNNNEQGDNGTNNIVLAALTFHVNGNAGDNGENEASDSARSFPVAINL